MTKKTGKPRKLRSDSVTGQKRAAQRADTSAMSFPDLPGVELLNDIGRQTLDRLYQNRPQGWTTGDLSLLIEAAHITMRLHEIKLECANEPMVATARNGQPARNVIHAMYLDHVKQLQTVLRDLGIRSKDGAEVAGANVGHTTKPPAKGKVFDWKAALQ